MKKTAERSQSFLEKFQGKKTTLTKEGLLHLLQHKLDAIAHSPKPIRAPVSEKLELQGSPNRKKLGVLEIDRNPAGSEREAVKAPQSQRYSLRKQESSSQQLPSRKTETQHISELKQPISSKLKLPSIQKYESQSQHSRIPLPSMHTQSRGRIKSLPKRGGQSESLVVNNFEKLLELDSYALKHLESLDKFQRFLVQQKLDGATRSVLSESK